MEHRVSFYALRSINVFATNVPSDVVAIDDCGNIVQVFFSWTISLKVG